MDHEFVSIVHPVAAECYETDLSVLSSPHTISPNLTERITSVVKSLEHPEVDERDGKKWTPNHILINCCES
jgi:hypothetical protein